MQKTNKITQPFPEIWAICYFRELWHATNKHATNKYPPSNYLSRSSIEEIEKGVTLCSEFTLENQNNVTNMFFKRFFKQVIEKQLPSPRFSLLMTKNQSKFLNVIMILIMMASIWYLVMYHSYLYILPSNIFDYDYYACVSGNLPKCCRTLNRKETIYRSPSFLLSDR